MTEFSASRRTRKKTLLTIVWVATCGLFAALLLHPAVPGAIRSVLLKPNRLLAEIVEYGAHVAVFLVATQLALVCLEGTTKARRAAILGLALVAAVAAEIAQSWVPTRGVDVLDAACNCAGVGLAALIYGKAFRLRAVLDGAM